jgi:DNA-binding NtrC family response regulator
MIAENHIVSIVEDELDVKNLFHDALSKNVGGITVLPFCDSVVALKHFNANNSNYKLVIADWRMPKIDGLELLKRIKKINRDVKSILISAYEVENEKRFERCVENGIIDKFIQKPVKMDYLCKAVNDQILA